MAKTFMRKGRRYFADSGKSVARWSASKKIGRPLKKEEVVHHGYRGKACNDPDNLWVFRNHSTHMRKKYSKKSRSLFG